MIKFCTDEVTSILDKIPIVENKARKKFVVLFIFALIKTRKVQFCELAEELNPSVLASSNETRIQDFFREVEIDYEKVALLLAFFLPRRGKLTLCIDRTEWDFGKCQVNFLMIVVRCKQITIPLYWELLDNNSGNSNTDDRIDILKKCINLLGAKRIGLFLGDREFIGHRWLKFLNDQNILFCVRMPKHHQIRQFLNTGKKGKTIEQFLAKRKVIKIANCMVDGVWGNVYAKRLPDGDILYLFGTAKLNYLPQLYRKRWRIECFFQNIKKRGFDVESTHLKCLNKLKKLMALVSIAYAFATNMGLHQHQRVKMISIKNHGYKSNSFFRTGINIIRDGIRRKWSRCAQSFLNVILRFLRWIEINPNNLPLPEF